MPYRAHRVKFVGDSGCPSGIQEELGTLEGGSHQQLPKMTSKTDSQFA